MNALCAGIVLLGMAFVCRAGVGTPSPGSLDLTYGGAGYVQRDLNGQSDTATCMIELPDGRIIVGGTDTNLATANHDYALTRYFADGSLDTTFGIGGKKIIDIGPNDAINSMVMQPDGKIVNISGNGGQFDLLRFSQNGDLDPTFGAGGHATVSLGPGTITGGSAISLQPDGKIVVGGTSRPSGSLNDWDFALARLTPSGTLDPTFGSSGTTTTTFSAGNDGISNLKLQPDGKIVAVGHSDTAVALARYLPNGSLDPSFGTGGKVTADLGSAADTGVDLLLRDNGSIMVACIARVGTVSSSISDFALMQFLGNGAPDTAFGTGGKTLTSHDGSDFTVALVEGLEEHFLLIGNDGFEIFCFNGTGQLTSDFGVGGKVIAPGPSGTSIANAMLTLDGNLLLAGFASGTQFDFLTARFIGPAVVPEPASTLALLLAACAMGRRRQRTG